MVRRRDEGADRQKGAAAVRRSARVVDVAALSGVSVATVSRAMSKPGMVRDTVRERVLEAARELGYSPNSAARALRLMRTRVVGVLVPTIDYAIFARLINAVENEMSAAGYLVLIATTGFDRRNIPVKARQLLERGAEALLCVGRVDDVQLKELLADRNVSLVATYTYEPDGLFPSIGFDNGEAARSISRLLREAGHRHIAVLLGPLNGNERQELRATGFREGFEIDAEHRIVTMLECSYSLEDGARAFDKIRRTWPAVTAVACSSDVLAAGVMIRCESLGVRVPEQLSVTGFDDLEFIGSLRTPLTTIHVPAVEMGRTAARALIAALDEGTPLQTTKLETRLVRRCSVGAPPGTPALDQPT